MAMITCTSFSPSNWTLCHTRKSLPATARWKRERKRDNSKMTNICSHSFSLKKRLISFFFRFFSRVWLISNRFTFNFIFPFYSYSFAPRSFSLPAWICGRCVKRKFGDAVEFGSRALITQSREAFYWTMREEKPTQHTPSSLSCIRYSGGSLNEVDGDVIISHALAELADFITHCGEERK